MQKKKFEFSKVIFLFVSILNVVVTGFTIYIVIVTRDSTPLCYLIPAVFAELAAATGFYYKKAEAENKIKLGKLYAEEAIHTEEFYSPEEM